MDVLLAHAFSGQIGWLEGKLVHAGPGRFDVVTTKLNSTGQPNKLIAGATPAFLASLQKKGMLKEDDNKMDGRYCRYCGDLHEDCVCGAQCPD